MDNKKKSKFKFWHKLSKKGKIITIAVGILVLLGIILACVLLTHKTSKTDENQTEEQQQEEIAEESKIKIIDENSNSRPYAVMINNHPTARPLQSGLQDAYIIYEVIVEGGFTRYLAVFKDQTTSRIGSVRSSRHYFLDYALENDAIYVHWGWSPQAQSDISSLGINNINGLVYGDTYFTTDKSLGVSIEHTRFTSMDLLKTASEKLKYRTTSDKKTLLNYQADSVDLANITDAKEANTIVIKYSSSTTDKYVYDSENKVYKRYVNDKEHTDYVTKEQYTFKNIITYQVSNSTISGDEKGRQEIDNIGSGTGYYISEGYAIPIKWSKETRSSQTKYTTMDGEELKVNDGNTFIQIQPKGQKLEIS